MNLVPNTTSFTQHAPATAVQAGFVAPQHRWSRLAAQTLPKIEAAALWMSGKRRALASGLDDCALIALHGSQDVVVTTEGVIA